MTTPDRLKRLKAHAAAVDRALSELKDRGLVSEVICLGASCPVQLGGLMPDGRRFYFRGRGRSIELTVEDRWAGRRGYQFPEASWLAGGELVEAFAELAALHAAGETKEAAYSVEDLVDFTGLMLASIEGGER